MPKRVKKRNPKKAAVIAAASILTAGAVFTGVMLYARAQMNKIPAMSFEECMSYTLKDRLDAVVTVGVLQDGQFSYKVYGKDAEILPKELHTYEICSLTKTFTAALVSKAVSEGKINLEDTIDRYLALPQRGGYPTVSQLLTHTSGYKLHYLASPMTANFFAGRNEFCGVTDKMITDKLASLSVGAEGAAFKYSNFGYAVLGLVLESVYGEEYTALVNDFAANTLGLSGTKISDGTGELGKLWDWSEGDAYMAAGALTSNIEDMLRYASLMLEGKGFLGQCREPIKTVHASGADNEMMGIRMDKIGMAWFTDEKTGVVWHNGATGNYNCYLGFDPGNNTAVVILSNLPPDFRIPATVAGPKLLSELK